MIIFGALLLTLLSVFVITYPFFRSKPGLIDVVEDSKLLELNSRRNTTYSMLKELEFDYQSGLLSAEDYHELEERYKKKAISVLKEMDMDRTIKDDNVEDEIENRVRQLRQQKAKFCTDCGERLSQGDKFCTGCGNKLG